jgi:transcriptional regulator with XRE-family HTH domain
MSDIDFPQWLQQQLDNKNWRVKDLAQYAHVSNAAVSRVLSAQRKADSDTLLAFATALNISPITMFRRAGKLPPGGEEISFEDWKHLINQLTPDEEEELRQLAELKITRRQKAEQAARTKNFKPRKAE